MPISHTDKNYKPKNKEQATDNTDIEITLTDERVHIDTKANPDIPPDIPLNQQFIGKCSSPKMDLAQYSTIIT